MKNGLVFGVVAALSAPALGSIPEGDLFLYTQGGLLRSGLISEDGLTIVPGVRVFYATLGEDVPNFTAEPGWHSPDGTFPGAGVLTFTINRALRKWDGTDFSLTEGSMALTFGPLGPVLTPATDLPVTGFDLPIDEFGGLHDHPDYELLAPATDGVYLLDLSFAVDFPGIGPSSPVWMLFGQNVTDETAEAAYEWATANIPAPSAAVLFGTLAAGLGMRRRR